MRNFLIILLVLLLIGAGGWIGYQRSPLVRDFVDQELGVQPIVAQQPTYITAQAQHAALATTVSATGNLEAAAQITLAFRSAGGRVAQVLVTEGQAVKQGDLLATLETTDLTLALAQAKAAVQISQAQLDKLQTPATESDLAAARAAVNVAEASTKGAAATLNSAQAGYRQLLADLTPVEKTVNDARIYQAQANLAQAQHAYNQVKDLNNVGMLPQSAALEQATMALEVAKAQAAVSEQGPNQAQVAVAQNQIALAQVGVEQAQSNLINAQNALQKLIDGPKATDLAIAQGQLLQAQLAQLQAENSLANAQLTAPQDGIINQVNLHQGELTSSAQPAILLTDLHNLEMKIWVDEIDMRQLALGQPAQITVEALPDVHLAGKVTEISTTAHKISGIMAYEVTILPDATTSPLRAGMSATAVITTAQVADSVILPNRFVQIDRQTNQAYVYKLVNNQPTMQAIQLGLRNERASQILTGLNSDDQVVLPK
ncbi:MAG: efflux RND transporter periplasmic adaptor subunit [Caldilineaceae bacterium]